MKNNIYKIMCAALLTVSMTSCLDTIILPDDKTVDEDFWQTKEDVASMVNGAYKAMTADDVIARLIVWGDFRTDEFKMSDAVTDESATTIALDEIYAVGMQTTNMYGQWSSFYNVINRCNIVLERAAEVMNIDPNYTMGDYAVDRSQMLALRALCYFYLVRSHRDIPYYTEAYMNSSQNTNLEQQAPMYVIDRCIADLQEASTTALAARGYTTTQWRRVGYMTDDAINALLADIFLWKASITHSAADYQQCVAYCDKVIESKKGQHRLGRGEVATSEYPLATSSRMYNDIFVTQNAEESILELQLTSNLPVCQYFYKYKSQSGTGGTGWFKATPLMGSALSGSYTAATFASGTALFSPGDMRYYQTCFSGGESGYDVRKIISQMAISSKPTNTSLASRNGEQYDYGGLGGRNYNIYRLTDIMLMKAEAMLEQVDGEAEIAEQQVPLRDVFNLLQAVNTRALAEENKADSLKWTDFRSHNKNDYEQYILQERLREFAFEGRRFYDLMRYNYRHATGVDYNRTLVQMVDAGETLPAVFDDMLTLMMRQSGTDQAGRKAKMQNEAYLYMPVPNSDLIVAPALRQNPAYRDTKDYQKSY